MRFPIVTIELRYEEDVILVRQRARAISGLLGFNNSDQTRISTAVSEITRNAYQYAGGGEIDFLIESDETRQTFLAIVKDKGHGIENLPGRLEGSDHSRTGNSLGIKGARRLVDDFKIDSSPEQGTIVTLGKTLPLAAPPVTSAVLERIAGALAQMQRESPLDEIRKQNQELITALDLLRQRDEELTSVNDELIQTNAGMIELLADLEDKSQQLRQSDIRLQARNEELKGFAYTVSHDLKVPLRGITGYADELDRKHRSELGERANFCINQIMIASRNLDHLIEDLLHFSRLDAERPTLTEVNPAALVEAILKDRSLVITELHIEVTIDIPFSRVRTWECGLLQVLTNLIDNAIKYSGKATPPRLGIRAEKSGNVWRISVNDNGVGFDMKYHDRIYGLFNRLVRVDEFEGTGLGLSIVKKVLDKLGGRVWAVSAPDQGATFFVELPIVE